TDADVGCILIRGAGRSFCAGGDLTAMLAMGGDARAFRAYIEALQALARVLRRLDVPTIAAVHGHVLAGGFELALACDLRIAAQDATFGLPDTALGLSPTSGMTWLLPRVVGEAWARHLLLTGEAIGAETAARIGLVTRVVSGADLEDASLELATSVAEHPPRGLAGIRSGLRTAGEATFEDALDAELEAEVACFETAEFQASLRRFAERRRSRA
ncbi:MAG: enoyl-CoA hydratase/isomerase family protein, partial [Chloroflexi bacterium]|nr:enoyl-CoA hydratase/isomerase family protein [Chloroflexota bacterium]